MVDAQTLQNIGLLFRSINFNFRQEIDRALRTGGVQLTFGEVSAMSGLLFHPGINGAQLARHNMVSAQAMNSVLRSLAARRYIERRPHPTNQRADSWHLTGQGCAALGRAKRIFEVVTSRMLSGLDARQVRALEDALRSCAASLEGGEPG